MTIQGLSPYLCVSDANVAIEFYEAAFGATPVTLYLSYQDADVVVARARELGASLESEVEDHFYGERSGTIRDPFGHRWVIGSHIEDVSPEEMQQRYSAMVAS